jgi:membrane-associated phospholipid phosphatase
MNRALLILAAGLAVLSGFAPSTSQAQVGDRSAVAPWIELELDAIASHRTNPPRAARGLAHVSVAMHVAAVAGGGARDDAVAGAASTVLAYLYPDEAARIDPGPPPTYGSAHLTAEMNDIYTVSQTLTDEQRRIADYWADGPGTVTPPGHWNRIALGLVEEANWSTLGSSRLFAVLNTAQADAFIACWDAKYAYWSLRPVTAIRRLIAGAGSWLSHIVTPPFPSYVSGHSTTSGAASTVLAVFFPDRASTLEAMAQEAAISRLYGGIHFRSDNEVGLHLGRRVGSAALRAYDISGS